MIFTSVEPYCLTHPKSFLLLRRCRPLAQYFNGVVQFARLPKEFPGPYLGLRFTYYYNLNVDKTTPTGPRNLPYVARECTVENYLTTSLSSDGGTPLSISPPGPV